MTHPTSAKKKSPSEPPTWLLEDFKRGKYWRPKRERPETPKTGQYTIYKATSKCGYIYIGVTSKTIEHRRYHHERTSDKHAHPFQRKIKELGRKSFTWEVVAEVDQKAAALLKESELIAEAKCAFGDKCLNIQTRPGEHLKHGAHATRYMDERKVFYHPVHGAIECTRMEMTRVWGLSPANVSNLFLGKAKSSHGWRLLANKDKKTYSCGPKVTSYYMI